MVLQEATAAEEIVVLQVHQGQTEVLQVHQDQVVAEVLHDLLLQDQAVDHLLGLVLLQGLLQEEVVVSNC